MDILPETSWARRFGFSLSKDDRELLDTQFHVHNPTTLSDLRQDIPKDLTIEEVEFAYEVLASERNRHLWIRCCECRRNHNHRRGLVLRFVDGSRATLGRNCGKTRHKLDHDERIKDFESRMGRARLLRQALGMLERAPVIHEHLASIRIDPTIAACGMARSEMMTHLPHFTRRLQQAEGGRLFAQLPVRDYMAEKIRDERLDRKLDVRARQLGFDRNDHGVDRLLFEELEAERDKDASKQPIIKTERRTFHTFAGHGFFTVIPRAPDRCRLLGAQLLEAFSALRYRSSSQASSATIQAAVKKFAAVVSEAIKLTDEIEAATTFLSPGNIAGVVRAVNRFWKKGDERRAALVGTMLCREKVLEDTVIDITLPPLGLIRWH
ncbi:MAG: hypothetical protein ACRYF2_02560 [Janthinobacterium lividum]